MVSHHLQTATLAVQVSRQQSKDGCLLSDDIKREK